MHRILEELLTQKRLAEKLDQSERTLERWRVEGTGPPFVKAGRRVLYFPQDVEDWLLATRRQSTSSPRRQPPGSEEPRTELSDGDIIEAEDAAFDDEERAVDTEMIARALAGRAEAM